MGDNEDGDEDEEDETTDPILWDDIFAAVTFVPTNQGILISWIATSANTNWKAILFGSSIPFNLQCQTPQHVGFGRLLLTLVSYLGKTCVCEDGKHHIPIYLQCNRAETATMEFYKSIGFVNTTKQMPTMEADESLPPHRCLVKEVVHQPRDLQTAHWRFGRSQLNALLIRYCKTCCSVASFCCSNSTSMADFDTH